MSGISLWLRKNGWPLATIVLAFFAATGHLSNCWKPTPRIVGSGLVIEINPPGALSLALTTYFTGFLQGQSAEAVYGRLVAELRKAGLADKRIREILPSKEEYLRTKSLDRAGLRTSPKEDWLIAHAAIQSMTGSLEYQAQWLAEHLPPSAVIIFTISNESRTQAADFSIKVQAHATVDDTWVTSASPLTSQKVTDEEAEVSFRRLAPNETVQLVVWLRGRPDPADGPPVASCTWDDGMTQVLADERTTAGSSQKRN